MYCVFSQGLRDETTSNVNQNKNAFQKEAYRPLGVSRGMVPGGLGEYGLAGYGAGGTVQGGMAPLCPVDRQTLVKTLPSRGDPFPHLKMYSTNVD